MTPRLEVLECSDNRVLARWKDGQWYPGTIQDSLNNGKYVHNCNECAWLFSNLLPQRSVIVFDDGDKKVLAKSSVVQMVRVATSTGVCI